VPFREVAQLQCAEGHPTQALDSQADRAAEPLDLAIPALGELELDPVAPCRRVAEDPRAIPTRGPVLEDNTSLKRWQCVGVETPGDEDVVDAADPVSGMRQA
jgi:hypothetical protein